MVTPVVLYFDGACEPRNPGGWMGWAWVALAADGAEVAHRAYGEGPSPANTNNIAEYRALIAGLEWLRDHGHVGIHVRGDSQLVIRQLLGAYRVNSPALRPLFEQAVALCRVVAPRLAWVPRARNARADAYSMAAIPVEYHGVRR